MPEKKFGSQTFRTTPVPVTEALRLQARLMKQFGKALGHFRPAMAGMKPNATEAEKAAADKAIVDGLGTIVADLDPDAFVELAGSIVGMAQMKLANGSMMTAELDNIEDRSQVLPIIGWVLREQLGDFFSAAGGLGGLPATARD